MAYKFTYDDISFCEDIMGYATRYHKKYERFYHDNYSGEDLLDKSRLHAIYYYTLNLTQQSRQERGCYKKDIHRQLTSLELKIPTNYEHFCTLLKEMSDKGIPEVLRHGSKNVSRYKYRKFDPILYEYAETLYASSLCTYREIHDKVKKKALGMGLEELSIHAIKRHFAQRSVQNRLRPIRNGKEWYLANIAKQQHFSKPQFAGQQLEIDGSRLQIPFHNVESNKIDFLTLFVILDVTSSCILGYAHGVFERSEVIRNAFKRFFSNHDFLPIQIVRDGGSAYKRKFKFIEELTTKRGVEWVVTHNPQGKPHVENFFKTFAKSICSYHEHFIGLGITSTHIDSRITSRSKLKKKIGDRKNLGLYEDLVLDIDHLITEYNHTVFRHKESAMDRFKRLFNAKEVKQLDVSDKVAMTEVFKSKAVVNCEIDITANGNKHFYQIPGETGESIEKVNVAYDPDNLDSIHLYNEQLDFMMTVPMSEVIPSMVSQRTSKQQARYLRELSERKSRYKQFEQAVLESEQRVAERSSNSLSYEVLKIHGNKEEELEAQNRFTRSLLEEESLETKEAIQIKFPPNSYHAKRQKANEYTKIVRYGN
ncbi:MAG: transposase family protein [Cyclobacteriaceae bacterium]